MELQRAWNPDPHNTLPFAERVQNEWLKGILALGLEYDEAHERVSKGVGHRAQHWDCRRHSAKPAQKIGKRFDLGIEDGPKYARRSGGFDEDDLYDAVSLPYGTDLHPPFPLQANGPPQSGETKLPSQSEVAAGKPKTKSRGRKGTASKEQRPTDLMDIDTNGAAQHPSPNAGDGNTSEFASPAVEDAPPVPQTTAEIGDEKDTQIESVLHPEAVTFKLTPSIGSTTAVAASIEHATFAPNEPQALLLAGQNVARIFVIPPGTNVRHTDLDLQATTVDVTLTDANLQLTTCNVLAFAWTPGCGTAVMAVWKTFASDDTKIASGSVVQLLPGSAENTLATRPLPGADNVRDVVALEWNAESSLLLSLSITGNSSWLRVWRHSPGKNLQFDVLPSHRETGKRFFNAVWLDTHRFVACGEDTVSVYNLEDGANPIHKQHEFGGAGREWHRVLYDRVTQWIVLLSNDTNELGRLALGDIDAAAAPGIFVLPATATDFDAQPTPSSSVLSDGEPRLLAVACETGQVDIIDMRKWKSLTTLALGMHKSAATCTWSPDGSLLAVAGDGRVVVWAADDISRPQELPQDPGLPRVIWTAGEDNLSKHTRQHVNGFSRSGDRLTNGVQRGLATMNIDGLGDGLANGNGHLHADDAGSQVSTDTADLPTEKLCWHADGSLLVYTLGDQVCVIRPHHMPR